MQTTDRPQVQRVVDKSLDRDVRYDLHRYVSSNVAAVKDAVVIDELTLHRKDGRVDVCVVNTQLHGYELKSGRDNLGHLPRQVQCYSQVLDYISVVVAERHLMDATTIVPKFWGIHRWTAAGGVELIRAPCLNLDVQKKALTQLLWRERALALLKEHNAHKGMSAHPKRKLWVKVEQACTHAAIHAAVLQQLKIHRRSENVACY